MTDQAILVTGAAGFIGLHVARQLLAQGRPVVGLDNLNSYYDPTLKEAWLALMQGQFGFSFVEADLADREAIASLFERQRLAKMVHLAPRGRPDMAMFLFVNAIMTGNQPWQGATRLHLY